jgi:hypothetical protein
MTGHDALTTGWTVAPAPDGCAYLLPNGWVHLDVDPSRREASVRRAVRRRVRREPRLAPYLVHLDRLLLSECTLAAAQGAQRVSLLAEPVQPAAQPAAQAAEPVADQAVTASVTLVVESLAEGTTALDAQAAFEWLVAEQLRTLVTDPFATLEIIEVGRQDVVRRTWTAPVGAVPSKHWQLVLPWPGRPSVALLTMASTCAPLWPSLEETFDACTHTFRWTWSSGGGGPGSD